MRCLASATMPVAIWIAKLSCSFRSMVCGDLAVARACASQSAGRARRSNNATLRRKSRRLPSEQYSSTSMGGKLSVHWPRNLRIH